jgi:hypothetical protein
MSRLEINRARDDSPAPLRFLLVHPTGQKSKNVRREMGKYSRSEHVTRRFDARAMAKAKASDALDLQRPRERSGEPPGQG